MHFPLFRFVYAYIEVIWFKVQGKVVPELN
jgi:hypothetical protein